MKVTEKKLDNNRILLEAVASPKDVEMAFDMAARSFAQQMNLMVQDGTTFAQAAEAQLGIKDLDMVINAQVPEFLVPFALDKKNIIPAFPPEAHGKVPAVRGKEYAFTAEVTPKPEYELNSYEPVTITVQPFTINEGEVDEQIAQLAERYTDYVDIDEKRPVAKGDAVMLKIDASQDGKPLPGLTTPGRTYTAGEGYMPDGFDENVIGMDVGETKSFTFEGPGIDEEGNETVDVVDCTVTILSLQKEVIPTINDEFVEKFMPMFKTYDDFRKSVEDGVRERHEEEYENYKKNIAASELAKRFEGRIADEVYEVTRDTMLTNIKADIANAGMKYEDFLEQNGGEQQFSMMLMMQVRETLVQGYSLDALYRHAKLSVSKEDLVDAARTINPRQAEAMVEQMEKTGRGFALRELAERMKANKYLLENATVNVVEPGAVSSN